MEGLIILVFVILTFKKIIKKINELLEGQTTSFDNSYLRKEKLFLIIMYLALLISGTLGYLKLFSVQISFGYIAGVFLIISLLSAGYVYMLKKLMIINKNCPNDTLKYLIVFLLFLGGLEACKGYIELIGFLYVISNFIVISFIKRVRYIVIENSEKIKECANSYTELCKIILRS